MVNNLFSKREIKQATKIEEKGDVESAFMLILDTALENKMSQDDIPKKLYIISDMEFNCADRTASRSGTLFQKIRAEYESHGYEMPNLVFWNVNARNDQSPMTMDDRGVQLVSGCSPSIFTTLMKGEFVSAYDLMLEVITSERYDMITV